VYAEFHYAEFSDAECHCADCYCDECRCAECHYAGCHCAKITMLTYFTICVVMLSTIMLTIIMLSVVMLTVTMSVIMLSVVMLSVAAPQFFLIKVNVTDWLVGESSNQIPHRKNFRILIHLNFPAGKSALKVFYRFPGFEPLPEVSSKSLMMSFFRMILANSIRRNRNLSMDWCCDIWHIDTRHNDTHFPVSCSA
jgi:hypothetical protein